MAQSNSSPRQLLGLVGDIFKLGAATVSAGLRITCEASAKARPHIQSRIDKVRVSLGTYTDPKATEFSPA